MWTECIWISLCAIIYFCVLLYFGISCSDYISSNGTMVVNNDVEWIWKEAVLTQFWDHMPSYAWTDRGKSWKSPVIITDDPVQIWFLSSPITNQKYCCLIELVRFRTSVKTVINWKECWILKKTVFNGDSEMGIQAVTSWPNQVSKSDRRWYGVLDRIVGMRQPSMTPSFQLNKLRASASCTATHQWQMFVFLPACLPAWWW